MNPKGSPEKIQYPDLAAEINEMREVDQSMRKKASQDSGVWDFELDKKHTEKVKQIIEQIGWPTAAKVGEETAHSAWLLVQHADHDIEFQKRCLAQMREQEKGEVRSRDVAYLEDRILTNEDKPQLYGTQFAKVEGKLTPLPIEDEANVDERRKEVGLGTLEEGIRRMRED